MTNIVCMYLVQIKEEAYSSTLTSLFSDIYFESFGDER